MQSVPITTTIVSLNPAHGEVRFSSVSSINKTDRHKNIVDSVVKHQNHNPVLECLLLTFNFSSAEYSVSK
jgi:hypothetical protein